MADDEKPHSEEPKRDGESGGKNETKEEVQPREAEARQVGESRLADNEVQNSAPEARETQLETLAVTSSEHLDGPGVNSVAESNGGSELREQDGLCHQQASLTGTEAQARQQFQTSASPASLLEPAKASASQAVAPVASSTLPEPRSVPPNTGSSPSEVGQENSLIVKTPISVPSLKTKASDGYNWRKYGQKQVKSPKGSRSYYKCTHSDCCAKKIECCDDFGHVTEIVCKGQHSHEPPRKGSSTKERRHASSAVVAKHNDTERPIAMLNNPDSSTSSKETMQESLQVVERKRQNPESDGSRENNMEEEHANEPESKSLKKSELACPGSLIKPGKKPKFVVHAAGDVGISGDGYRWRKYGQKMVKGNPNPRNYYRCTSAGCPVRKHIETAVDNTNAVVITYKGIHDHDMPVPKKRHGPPSGPLVAAAAPASMNNLQNMKSDVYPKQISSTQRSADTEGESSGGAMDLGGEKAIESARTLLSIGFEIKPC